MDRYERRGCIGLGVFLGAYAVWAVLPIWGGC